MKNKTIHIQGKEITVTVSKKGDEYISLTDTARFKNSEFTGIVIANWLSTRYTFDFMSMWEKMHNPNFNVIDFNNIKNDAGSNGFIISSSQWIKTTNAIGIRSSPGRYGGTFAHKDIAFEFATWISPEFKLYLIKEFQRLKIDEHERLNLDWSAKRMLTKINYRIHTDSIKENIIIPQELTNIESTFIYATEADILNMAFLILYITCTNCSIMYNNDYTIMNKKEIYKLLNDIGLAPAEISVYIALLDDAVSVKDIMNSTNEKRPTVYYSLNSLEKRGLISKSGKEYGNKFQLEPVEKVFELIDKNIRKQHELLEKAKNLKDFYPQKKSTQETLVSYFDTIESIKSAIFHSLYGTGKEIRTIVPAKNFFEDIDSNFKEEYVAEKLKRNIKTIALWEDIPSKHIIDKYYKDLKIKQMPLDMHNSFETTVFIYDNKTLYISPKKESHAVLIQSTAHSKMMKTMFDTIWKNGIEVKKL